MVTVVQLYKIKSKLLNFNRFIALYFCEYRLLYKENIRSKSLYSRKFDYILLRKDNVQKNSKYFSVF